MIKSCTTCLYGKHAKMINGINYVICKNPIDYKSCKKSELGLKCWKENK